MNGGLGLGAWILGGSAPLLGSGRPAARGEPRIDFPRPGPDPTLVLVQLSGGNDGLNTLVPWSSDVYHRSRPKLRVPEKDVLDVDERIGFAPQLPTLHRAFLDGHVGVVEGVGYPDMVRSHFESLDIWHTARFEGRRTGKGWLVRLLESLGEAGDLSNRLVHVGGAPPYALQCETANPLVFRTPTQFRLEGPLAASLDPGSVPDVAARQATDANGQRAFLRTALADAIDASNNVCDAVQGYRPRVRYPDHEFAHSLAIAAALIHARLGFRVISVELADFDTHTEQHLHHPRMLIALNRGLAAFLTDLHGRPESGNVLVVVFSEFGRRVAENASLGTDHGTAGPILVAGPAAKPGFHGTPASLEELDDQGDPAPTTDFRSVYATLAARLFGVDPAPIVGGEFPLLEFV